MKGTLYVVGTPIGNLGDITIRAIDTLKQVDLILCEDSRITRRLLERYKIATPLLSYHQHSANSKIDRILADLESGKNLALVTDAGTPVIQDPGGQLVNHARQMGIEIVAIPGPSAITAALSIAGINADSFYFLGFLPKKKGRQTLFKNLSHIEVPLVIYESPMRIAKTLKDIVNHLGDRKVILARELTKKFEEIISGQASDLLSNFEGKKARGEFVMIVLANED